MRRVLASIEQRDGYVTARVYEAKEEDDFFTLVRTREGSLPWVQRALELCFESLRVTLVPTRRRRHCSSCYATSHDYRTCPARRAANERSEVDG